jgi:hypothetical protein
MPSETFPLDYATDAFHSRPVRVGDRDRNVVNVNGKHAAEPGNVSRNRIKHLSMDVERQQLAKRTSSWEEPAPPTRERGQQRGNILRTL